MPIDVTWTDPDSLARGSGQSFPYAYYEDLVSNIKRLGGDDGDAKTSRLQIGSTPTFSNAQMSQGLTIDQDGFDDEILTLKSSDVAHGMTSQTETDSYGVFMKASTTAGGLRIRGFSEGTGGMQIDGAHTTDDTTKTTSSSGAFRITGYLKTGTTFTTLGANANILVLTNEGATRFIFDGDGDSHQDVGTAWTNFDHYDDAALLNALAAEVARPGDPIKDEFRGWLAYNREELERARLVTFNPDGHHFVNMSRLMMLLVGAARQTGLRLASLERRTAPLLGAR